MSKLRVELTAAVAFLGLLCSLGGATHAAVLGYWRFEDSPGFLVDSAQGLALTHKFSSGGYPLQVTLPGSGAGSTFSDPIPRTGAPNAKAGSFGTQAGILVRESDTDVRPAGDFTIEAMINHAAAGGTNQFFVSRWHGADPQRAFAAGVTTGNILQLFVSADGINTEVISSGLTITPGQDYYVGISFDLSPQQVTFYTQNLTLGGALQSTVVGHTRTGLSQATMELVFGALTSQNTAFQWNGLIDEVRISGTVLPVDSLLVSVPEPGAIASLAGVGWLLSMRRRRGHAGAGASMLHVK